MFKLLLVAFAQVLVIQLQLAAAHPAYAEDVHEKGFSAAVALQETDISRKAYDAGDIPGFAGPFRTGGAGPYRYDRDRPYGFYDSPYRYGDGPYHRNVGPFRTSNYDESYSEAYSYAASGSVA